jgi:hypothetical protein
MFLASKILQTSFSGKTLEMAVCSPVTLFKPNSVSAFEFFSRVNGLSTHSKGIVSPYSNATV